MIAKYVPGTANSTAKSPNTNLYTATASHCGDWSAGTGSVVEVAVRLVMAARGSVSFSSKAAMILLARRNVETELLSIEKKVSGV
jgi:hypothetical protein